ncbi:MAG: stage II sporulation protein M [Planctomycetota bacterium]
MASSPPSPPPDPRQEDLARLRRLRALLERPGGEQRWTDEELRELPRLYRHACSVVARFESAGESAGVTGEARRLIGTAHAVLHRERTPGPASLAAAAIRLFGVECPRAIRREWRLLAAAFVLLYGLAGLAGVAVARDLDLAPSLLDPAAVAAEIEGLRATEAGEPFRGNFDFGLGESPATAGWILAHNMFVGILFFSSALVAPVYLYLLATNGLMLGTYTAVADHWGQGGAISSILWCHGVIEIQAIVLAGTAGLVLARAVLLPGPWTRRRALALEGRRALRLLAPVFPLLFAAGLIEGFVSPHASLPVRLSVAVGTGAVLVAWAVLGGRWALRAEAPPSGSPATPGPAGSAAVWPPGAERWRPPPDPVPETRGGNRSPPADLPLLRRIRRSFIPTRADRPAADRRTGGRDDARRHSDSGV